MQVVADWRSDRSLNRLLTEFVNIAERSGKQLAATVKDEPVVDRFESAGGSLPN